MIYKIRSLFLSLFVIIFFFLISFWFVSSDLLWDAFRSSWEHIVKVTESESSFADFLWNIANFLLVLSSVLWVTMILYWWIMFILSMWDEWKMKKARNMLFYIWLWLILALSSFWIVKLIQSISVSSLA